MSIAGLNNRSNGQQCLSVTEPISMGGPLEFDVVKTQELEKCLADVGLYESQEEAVSGEEVLGRLDQLFPLLSASSLLPVLISRFSILHRPR